MAVIIQGICVVLFCAVMTGIWMLINYFGWGFILGFFISFFIMELGQRAITGEFFWLSGRY